MRIGYIGFGIVGKSCHRAFKHNAEHYIVDPAQNQNTITTMVWVFKPDVIFVSVPAPTLDDGSVDTTTLDQILQELTDNTYQGIVVVKSTIPPQDIERIYNKYAHEPRFNLAGDLNLIYSPEFIREDDWEKDAVKPSILLISGPHEVASKLLAYYNNHSHVKDVIDVFYFTDVKTASLVKYTINSYLAMKVVFMNQIYELSQDLMGNIHPETWDEFTKILSKDPRIGLSHMKVPGKHGFGYAGSCFPKDVKAMIGFDAGGRLSLLKEVSEANLKLRLK